MTDSEWDACNDPDAMLSLLIANGASDRKLRLHLAAVCRCLRPRLMDERSRDAIRVAEEFADGRITSDQRAIAFQQARHVLMEDSLRRTRGTTLMADWLACAAAGESENLRPTRVPLHRDMRVALIREIFGNVRPPVLQSSPGSAAVQLARAIYEDRDPLTGLLEPSRLPLLADVLEEAGVNEPTILNHLRGRTFHFRGCFAVDAVLGRV